MDILFIGTLIFNSLPFFPWTEAFKFPFPVCPPAPFPLESESLLPLLVLFRLPPDPEASEIRNVRPRKLRPDPALFCPKARDRLISFSSPNRTKPYPLERPVEGSYMIFADFVLWNSGVKSATSSPSVTSRPRSPTKIEYSPSHLGWTPGKPVAQFTDRITIEYAKVSGDPF